MTSFCTNLAGQCWTCNSNPRNAWRAVWGHRISAGIWSCLKFVAQKWPLCFFFPVFFFGCNFCQVVWQGKRFWQDPVWRLKDFNEVLPKQSTGILASKIEAAGCQKHIGGGGRSTMRISASRIHGKRCCVFVDTGNLCAQEPDWRWSGTLKWSFAAIKSRGPRILKVMLMFIELHWYKI